MQLTPVTLDFETYYDADYSLRKIKTALYVSDPRFKVQGVGIKYGNKRVHYTNAQGDISGALQAIPWDKVILVGHNLNFDGLILHTIFGCTPAAYFDTKAVANVILPASQRRTLDNVAKLVLGLTVGKATGLEKTKGIRDLTPELDAILGKYCIRDVDLTYQIYEATKNILPVQEQLLSSLTTRMACEPVLEIDTPLLKKEIERLELRVKMVLATCPVPQKVLSSNPQFAAWMKQSGLTVPMKESKTTGKMTYAFAKDDMGYRELQAEHPELNGVWEARRVVKSTIELTRALAFYNIGLKGLMPMPLNYYGAHTGRWSGADGLNVQNLPRGGALRKAILAPTGYQIVVLDLAQIELRINAWFCGELAKLDILRNHGDVYSFAATRHFGYDCVKDAHPNERQFGKMLELALGFGMGWRKLRVNAGLGFMGTPPVLLTQLEAQSTVNKWRYTNAATETMWRKLTDLIPAIHANKETHFNGLIFGNDEIKLPNGMSLQYYDLRFDSKEGNWIYDTGKKLYGGILLENIVQALARIVVADQLTQADAMADVRVVSSTHDEIIALCPDAHAARKYEDLKSMMSISPKWAPDLPLAADGGWAKNYSK